MIIDNRHYMGNDRIELYVDSHDEINWNLEGERLTYTAYVPFINNDKLIKKAGHKDKFELYEWIVKQDRSFLNKLNPIQWYIVFILLLPILIPVMAYLSIKENKFKRKKNA